MTSVTAAGAQTGGTVSVAAVRTVLAGASRPSIHAIRVISQPLSRLLRIHIVQSVRGL